MRNWVIRTTWAVGCSLMGAGLATAQEQDKAARAAEQLAAQPEQTSAPADPRPIAPGDYGGWERLGRAQLSPDGKWMAVEISRVDESRALHLRMLATPAAEVFEEGRSGSFSSDSNWFAYRVGPSPKERKAAEKSKKELPETWHLRSLMDGKEVEFEKVRSLSFRDDAAFLLVRKEAAKGSEGGSDLLVHELATGVQTSFGNVGDAAWNDDGTLLAMVVDTADGLGNGVQVYDTRSRSLHTLDSSDRDYVGLTWREDAADLAVMREHEHGDDEDVTHSVLAFRGLGRKEPRKDVFDPSAREAFPDMRLVSYAGLRWSDDGAALFFGIKEWKNKPAPKDEDGEKDGEDSKKGAAEDAAEKDTDKGAGEEGGKSLRDTLDEPSNVEIWHARDIDIQPLQKKRAAQKDRESFLSVWWLQDDRFVQLGSELSETVQVADGDRVALGGDNTPYERGRMFGPSLYDRYRIDTTTGEAVKYLEANKYSMGAGPGGRFAVYVKDDQIWSHDGKSGTHHDLTSSLGPDFIDHSISTLTDEKPPYGMAGWSRDGNSVYLYDRHDIWRVRMDGKGGQRLTDGAEQQIRYRRQVLNEDEPEKIDPKADMLLTVYGDRSKKSGFARLGSDGKLRRLRFEDDRLGSMIKAEDVDVFAWVEEDFDDSPDVFTAGPDLSEPRQVTVTNPQAASFLWGRSELVDYVNDRGETLQAALHYPAGYEAGNKYPMIVYIYELRSQDVHRYSVPTERHPYNPAVFTAQGYFVYQPDITYRPQNPGLSAKECVVPAVKKMIDTGMVDPERVGLVGHSWGGYQTAFLSTTTDIFAACVAGAPLTNMMSMSMSIYWNSGQTDAWIFHESQGRMDQPFWLDIDTYRNNSAIFNLETMTTPLLMAFGDEDGAVDWHQGVEFYNAARLARKDFVLLVYPGENHSNSREENQVDYHHRVLEWFGHYLKGEEAPTWIVEGKPYRERRDELKELDKGKGDKGKGDK